MNVWVKWMTPFPYYYDCKGKLVQKQQRQNSNITYNEGYTCWSLQCFGKGHQCFIFKAASDSFCFTTLRTCTLLSKLLFTIAIAWKRVIDFTHTLESTPTYIVSVAFLYFLYNNLSALFVATARYSKRMSSTLSPRCHIAPDWIYSPLK